MRTQRKETLMAVYELPELDYAYDALEPHISAEIMEDIVRQTVEAES